MPKYKLAVKVMLLLLALSAVVLLLSLAYDTFQDLSRRSRANKVAAFKLQEREFQQQAAEYKAWKALPRELKKFRKRFLISMDQFGVFRRTLDSCLGDNQLKPSSINFQFGGISNQVRKVSVSFNLEGSYRNIKKFIHDMESKPEMSFFDRIELFGNPAGVKGKFNMEVYLGE